MKKKKVMRHYNFMIMTDPPKSPSFIKRVQRTK